MGRGITDRALRALDVAISLAGLIGTVPVCGILFVLIPLDSRGPAIFAQQRVGRRQQPFTCYKFRTMKIGTRSAASHEVGASAVTSLGHFLRRSKLDELPQLLNVLRGDMSLVGPRPCLLSQTELIDAREGYGLHAIRPGITGPAQVAGVDMSDPPRLARLDAQWLNMRSVPEYLRLIFLTASGRGRGDRVNRTA